MKTYFILMLAFVLPCNAQDNNQRKATPKHIDSPVVIPPAPIAKPEIVINLTEDGTIKIDGKVVKREELARKLRAVSELNSKQSVRIRSEGQVPYGTIVDVIGICQLSEVLDVPLLTEPAKTGQNAPGDGDKPAK